VSQSKRMSAVEAVTNTVVGLGVAIGTQIAVFPIFGIEVSHAEHWLIAIPFVATSILRSYIMRRFFNYLHKIEADIP